MIRALALALLAGILGCADGRSVAIVSVTASGGGLGGVKSFQVTVQNGGQTAGPTSVVLPAAVALPPPETFALGFDADRHGGFTVAVEALDVNGATIARGTGAGEISPSETVEVDVVLPGRGGDGGMDARGDAPLPDLSGPDLTGADLSVLANGAPCSGGGACKSGNCVTGVCCALPSCPVCSTCAPAGVACTAVAAGMPDPTGACVDSTALCETAICTGDGGCTPAAAMTTCAAASCVGSTLTPTRACDGVSYGGCPSMGSGECPSHLSCLDATSCRAGQCTVGADCAGGYCCKAGACVDDTQSSSCGASCSDCSGAISGHVCVAGGCGCNSNLDCGANLPECDFATHRCVECVSSDQCSSARPVCKNGVCSGCKNMNDCNNAPFGGSCNMGTGACLCQSNLDCLSTRAPTCVAGSCGCGVGGPCAVGHACAAGICQ